MQKAYENVGLEDYEEIKCIESIFGLRYYDCFAPLTEEFRKTASFYADFEDHEVKEYTDTLRGMIENGTLPQYLLEKE